MNILKSSFAVLPANLNQPVLKKNIKKQNDFDLDEKNDFKDALLLMIKSSNEKKLMKALTNKAVKLPQTDKDPVNKNSETKGFSETDSEKRVETYSKISSNNNLHVKEIEAIIALTAKILGINEEEYFL